MIRKLEDLLFLAEFQTELLSKNSFQKIFQAEPVSAGRKVTKVDDADDWWSD